MKNVLNFRTINVRIISIQAEDGFIRSFGRNNVEKVGLKKRGFGVIFVVVKIQEIK